MKEIHEYKEKGAIRKVMCQKEAKEDWFGTQESNTVKWRVGISAKTLVLEGSSDLEESSPGNC